jgi:hypothetical protein
MHAAATFPIALSALLPMPCPPITHRWFLRPTRVQRLSGFSHRRSIELRHHGAAVVQEREEPLEEAVRLRGRLVAGIRRHGAESSVIRHRGSR